MAEQKKLCITVTCVNVKKIDLKAYGIKKALCMVKVKVGDKEVKTTIQAGLDPTWEETFEFDIVDEKATKCSAIFYMGEGEDQKQIGDECEYLIPELKIGKPVYKALIIPGGKVDMMMTAWGFGKEEEDVDPAGFMGLMDSGDGMMMMDSDEEEEEKK
eukprot:gene687-2119_t